MATKTKSQGKSKEKRDSLELLYNISRELAADLDLSSVLERILFLSLKNVGATSGSILVLGDQGQLVHSAVIYGGNILGEDTRRLRSTLEDGLAGWVKRNKEAALVENTEKDDRWSPRTFSKSKKYESKSSVSAPLLVRDKLVGIITLSHPDPGYFDLDDLALVQSIADQAGVVVLNGQLYNESRNTARNMKALADSAAAINVSLNLDEVIQTILEQTANALNIEAASLALIDPNTGELEFRAATGESAQVVIGMRIKMGQGIAGWVAQQGESVIVPDTQKDPRFSQIFDDNTGFQTRSIACVPIRSQGEVIGVLEVLNPADPFDQEILKVLEGIGNLAGTAIDHARLFEQVGLEHSRYLELFDASIDPILITDADGNIIEANRQAVAFLGYDPESISQKNIHHFHQVNWNKVGQNFEDLINSDPISYESIIHNAQGTEVQVEVHVRKINIDGGHHYQWILRDITERLQLDQLRDDFASMIYHDLRSPLANVTSGLDVLSSILPEDGDPTIRTVLDIAIRSTERVHRLASALLDANRLEAGQRIGNPEPVDPAELIQDSIEIITPMAKPKSQELKKKIPAKIPQVMVDVDMIKRVIINLLENAVKYSSNGSLITIIAKQKGNWVHVSIEDNGPGIPEEEQERIFEKFHRVHTSGPGAVTGLGIGLAFCKLAVEGHGGEIWVENKKDKGSRFIFTLPVA